MRACAYYDEFDKPKIIFPDIGSEPRFAFDERGTFVLNTGYMLPVNDKFLLGVLNSETMWMFAKETCTVVGDAEQGGRLRLIYQSVTEFPIPDAPASERLAIAELVEKCLAARGVDCAAHEAEINARVAALYGLD